jgi:alpha-D-ribose 1-methylphosphonate 5-triphosphate synthase subunit PhnG
MKTLLITLLSCFIGLTVWAQTTPTVTIKVNGNRNREVRVDGENFMVSAETNSVNSPNAPITISQLALGQHTLQVIRANPNNSNNTITGATTTFNLRANYDLKITVNQNGSVQLTETRMKKNAVVYNRTPMSDANYNALLKRVQSHWTTSGRTTELNKIFAVTTNYYTTAQARQLIELSTSQSTRLALTKTAYKYLTDPVNYSSLTQLLTSQASRNDFEAYVVTYNNANPGFNTATTNTGYVEPMSTSNFNQLYSQAQNQSSNSGKLTFLSTTFANSYNYFTAAQVRQLLLLVYYENDRLTLAKSAYDNVVDPVNYNSQLYDVFTYPTSRAELATYIGSSVSKQPMSSANFNSIYQSAGSQWSSNAKYTYIAGVFENNNNYFSVSQARQLIQMIIADNEKLQLTKLVYDNITDPGNFSSLRDVFGTQSVRNEFDAFVQNNGAGAGSTNLRVPMTDANFNALYSDINSRYGSSAKLMALTDAFNNSYYFFTSYQARQLIQLVSSETDRLQLAKSSYKNITDPTNFTLLRDLFNTQSYRNEFDYFAQSNGLSGSTNLRVPMTDANFNALYSDINSRFGLGAKYSALTDAFNNANYYFTSYQARQLIQLVSSETNRLELAKASYRNITDPTNFTLLRDLFSTQSYRNEFDYFAQSNGITGSATVRIPMTEANFNTMYRDVQSRFGLGAKFSALVDIFNNTSNYFTTAQAKQLIQLVSSETNRLTLAKSSYRTITDRQNFTQIYDILASQSSRDELAAYVNSYPVNQ